ncbi:CaiB/BaiF CoA-transferase family protein [Arthrobacter sp. I3]|uniref:CaiB/BaiF CoA transferase family protein n=1 Tax=Arthrobacter sp. I3 TaxID=218158 RepID=UPI0004874DEF|nr:CaiB/BaiF CoA-transferase family protein [Arthrobacter sp. I3]
MPGPLNDLRVVELGGMGPVPHAAMVLADLGADVVRIERPAPTLIPGIPHGAQDVVLRGRRLVTADLRDPGDHEQVLRLIRDADVVLEGFRPGAAERLNLGPRECVELNPRLVYGRMTGWGQEGELSARAGHDINYLALTGVLGALGRAGNLPCPPMGLVADGGGGSMLLLVGVLAALWERERSGVGDVIDAAMIDGVSLLSQMIWTFKAAGQWIDQRGSNLTDSGAPFYDTYETSDGGLVAVGALEPAFFAALLEGLGLADAGLPDQYDREGWPVLRARFTSVFRQNTRDEWAETFRHVDACVSPVLSFDEASEHPQLKKRGSIVTIDGVVQSAPAPRFARHGGVMATPPSGAEASLREVAEEWSVPVRVVSR